MVLDQLSELAFECRNAEAGSKKAVAYSLGCLAERMSHVLASDPARLHSKILKISDEISSPIRSAAEYLSSDPNDTTAMTILISLAAADAAVADIEAGIG